MSTIFATGMNNLSKLSSVKSRSISAENFTGAPGKGAMAEHGTGERAARDLGVGFNVSPSVSIPAGEVFEMANIEGSGAIQHIWLTCFPDNWRHMILRMYWDNEATPSVEVPIGDFFLSGWCKRANIRSLAVAVNPAGGMNCYWFMPFRKHARITVENMRTEAVTLYYSVDYALGDVDADEAYFHAQWRRSNPLEYKADHVLLDGVKGHGHYVGTYLAWGVNNNGWWGEGEIKFFMDGDKQHPTICGTGTEDYFGGAWDFEMPQGQYCPFTGPYTGLPQVLTSDELYSVQKRFGMYRFHITDPIRFEKDLKVTIQALGWRSGGRYLPLKDDIASVAFWYQADPHAAFKALPDYDGLEVI